MIRHSRQRDAIKSQLSNRMDHPTAETIYSELKETNPQLSVATVYRNLKQLEDWGEVRRITTDGATRYDYRVQPHSHFFCRECGAVLDMPDEESEVLRLAQDRFGGKIENCSTNFYGVCPECMKKERQ